MRSVNVETETIVVVVVVVVVIGIGVGARKFFASEIKSEISFQAAISGYATIPAFTLLEIFI